MTMASAPGFEPGIAGIKKSRAFDQLGDAPMMMVAERDGFEPTSFRLKGGHPKPLDERSKWRGLGGSNTYLLGGNQARTPVRQARIVDGGESGI